MKLTKQIALSMALVTLIALTAVGASAETLTRATFTLPYQAYWNDTLLPPGQYTLSLNGSISGVPTIYLRGEGVAVAFVAPAGCGQASGRSLLKADVFDGTYVIREFDAGPLGKSFRFPVSKVVRNQALNGEAHPATVQVSTAAGL